MTRELELLKSASEAFKESIDPFSTNWLVEHDVTADECFGLSEQISICIRFFLWEKEGGETKSDAARSLFLRSLARMLVDEVMG